MKASLFFQLLILIALTILSVAMCEAAFVKHSVAIWKVSMTIFVVGYALLVVRTFKELKI